MKLKSFCIYFILFLFWAFVFNFGVGVGSGSDSGSGSADVAPTLIFSSWQAGRGVGGGPSDAAQTDEKWYTFATNSETKCQIDVAVKYATNQPENASKLTRYEWKVTGVISLPGLSKDELKKHTFTFAGKDKKSGAVNSLDTTFSYTGVGTLTSHWAPTGGKTEQRKYCSNYSGNKTPQKGRKLSINIKFIGYYGDPSNEEQKREIDLALTQDTVDHMRQEYIDQSIFVPEYAEFKASDAYNHGHYNKMLNGGLEAYRKKWLKKCNELNRKCSETYHCTHKVDGEIVCKPPNCPVEGCDHNTIEDFVLTDFKVTSAYRNPHHNRYHVKISSSSPHGLHQYGYALDITTPDIDNDGTAEQVYKNEAKSPDGVAMSDAAEAAGADYHPSWESYGSITHADWRNDYKTSWPPKNNSSLEVSSASSSNTEQTSTTTTTTESTIPETPSTSETLMHACSLHATTVSGNHSRITPPCGDSAHAGYACQISSDHNTEMSGWSGPFYECQPHTDYPCGHIDPTANSAYHAYGTFPCGISTHIGHLCTAAAASDALNHTLQASCLVTNANGDSCTVTNFYACQSHTHVYPAPTISCGRSGCTQTVTSSTQHSATCASGHSYWTCNPSDVYHHITRTCRYTECGKSWERCSTVGGTPICDVPWRKRNGWSCWW